MAIVFAVLLYEGMELFRVRNKQCEASDVARLWQDEDEEFNEFGFDSIGAFMRVNE